MVTRAFTVLLAVSAAILLAATARAGEIEGHVFGDNDDPMLGGTPGVYDPGIDAPTMDPIILTMIGEIGGPPGDETTVLGQWFAMPEPDGAYAFRDLPDNGIFQIDLPFMDPAAGFNANIVTIDPMTGMKMAEPVPAPPLGITVMPPTPTEVDIPVLPGVAPCALFTPPTSDIVMGAVFVDRNPGGQTGGNGTSGRGGICVIGNQNVYGEPADAIEIVMQCLDATGSPVGAPYTTIVGSTYTFVPAGETDPFTFDFPGWYMFLTKSLADGETVRVSIDPSQPGLAGLLPVSPTTVVQTRQVGAVYPDEENPGIEFRFQPAFDLGGRVTLEDAGGTVHPVAGITLTLIDLVTNMQAGTTTTDRNGDYEFPDLFNSVYMVQVQGTGAPFPPSGVRQIENLAPADLDFAFDQTNCPDVLGPTLVVPANITVECASASGNPVTWAASATDNMTAAADIVITYAPFQPGDTIPPGLNTISVEATDLCGNVTSGSFTITVDDTTPPAITASLLRPLLWPARRGLVSPALTATAMDICDGPVNVVVTVFSDEDQGTAPFAPDALGTSVAGLRLRMERNYPGDGRVYLVRVTATDASGNTAMLCKSAYVPLMPYGAYIVAVRDQAADGEMACMAADALTGVPAGFQQILQIGVPTPP